MQRPFFALLPHARLHFETMLRSRSQKGWQRRKDNVKNEIIAIGESTARILQIKNVKTKIRNKKAAKNRWVPNLWLLSLVWTSWYLVDSSRVRIILLLITIDTSSHFTMKRCRKVISIAVSIPQIGRLKPRKLNEHAAYRHNLKYQRRRVLPLCLVIQKNEYKLSSQLWTLLASSWNKTRKKFTPVGDLNSWPLRYQCQMSQQG